MIQLKKFRENCISVLPLAVSTYLTMAVLSWYNIYCVYPPGEADEASRMCLCYANTYLFKTDNQGSNMNIYRASQYCWERFSKYLTFGSTDSIAEVGYKIIATKPINNYNNKKNSTPMRQFKRQTWLTQCSIKELSIQPKKHKKYQEQNWY